MRLKGTFRILLAPACLVLTVLLLTGCATSRKQQALEKANARKATARLDVGIGHMDQGRTAIALREFLNAEALDPRNARIQYALGEGYLSRGKPEKAEFHYKRALELYSDYHDARLSLAGLHLIYDRNEEAIEQCNILIDDPTFPAAYRALTNRGLAESRIGRGADARRSLELALEFNSVYWPAMLNLAILEEKEGHPLEAIGLMQETLALDPGPKVESEVNYRLAEIYIALGKKDRAVTHLGVSVARAPDSPWAVKSEEYLKLLR